MRIEFPGFIAVALIPSSDCVGLFSKQNILLFDWIIWKQIVLPMTYPFSSKYVGILLRITSTLRSPYCDEAANLLLRSE